MEKKRLYGRVAAVVVTILVLLTAAAVVNAATTGDNGIIDRWVVKDRSSDPSPVSVAITPLAYTISEDELNDLERRRRGRVSKVRVKDRSSDPHRRPGRGGPAIWCRTARAVGVGGNDLIHDLVHGAISQRFCWNPKRNKIVSLGGINLSSAVSVMGSTFLWHRDGFGPVVKGEGRTCDGRKCWDYRYRRGQFTFERGVETHGVGVTQHVSVCASITMRGTGRVIVGKPRC
jgi:hypothetical protein